MTTKISYYNGVFDSKSENTIGFQAYLDGIRDGLWQDEVLNYRSVRTDAAKKLLHAVTPSGWFEHRRESGLKEASGMINIDLDQKDNPDINLLQAREELYADPYVYAGHVSVSGTSLSLYFKINPKKHYESFLAIEKYLAKQYRIMVDPAAKDISRLRFVSYDPELYQNQKAKKWTDYIEKAKQIPKQFTSADYVTTPDDFGFVLDQIKQTGTDLTGHYDEWVRIGMAIAGEYGEGGRNYFHIVSSQNPGYSREECDAKYSNFLASSTQINIATFFWLAKKEGLQIRSPRTERIVELGTMRKKQVGKSGGFATEAEAIQSAQKYLHEVEGIAGEDVQKALEQIKVDQSQSKNDEAADLQIKTILQVARENKVRKNLISGMLETDGRSMDDTDLNSLYLQCYKIDSKIKRTLFDTIFFSNQIPSFNPFLEFIEKNKHLKPTRQVQKLLDSINEDMTINGMPIKTYKETFVKKWLLSIVASWHGTYSLMILVFTGRQGTGKTNWFRWLLPEELQRYYAESKLDGGKDDEIAMCQNALICDDEFGGKSKQEAKKLKDISSKQTFTIRRPYGRVPEKLNRIAVLCGTSNDDEILNDPTGNRRIIPLKISSIDPVMYADVDKTELFIELYHQWKSIGDGWMLTPDEVQFLGEATKKHEQTVIELDLIVKNYEVDNSYQFNITSSDVKVFLEQKTMQRLNLYKIGQSLRQLGYNRRGVKINGITSWCWNIRTIDKLEQTWTKPMSDELPF